MDGHRVGHGPKNSCKTIIGVHSTMHLIHTNKDYLLGHFALVYKYELAAMGECHTTSYPCPGYKASLSIIHIFSHALASTGLVSSVH